MLNQFSRTELLLGREGVERLARAHVAVFGLGGVGGYAAEALVRSGVGALDLIDSDRVSLTNLNRQILATHRTLGQYKADAARDRALEINPEARVTARRVFYGPDTAGDFDFSQYDYVIDAIDTVTGKLALIQQALAAGTPIISCMGAGNKLDPTAFRVADIYETSVCPLARVMRRELGRLETSLKLGQALNPREILCFLHYPPIYANFRCGEIMELLQRYGVRRCVYGHLHSESRRWAVEGVREGIEFILVSGDHRDFTPLRLAE